MLTIEEQVLIAHYRHLSHFKKAMVHLYIYTGKSEQVLRFCCKVICKHAHPIYRILTPEG